MTTETTITGFQTYKRLLRVASRYWPLFLTGVVATIIGSGIDASIAWFVKPLVDHGLIDRNPQVIHWMPVLVIVIFVLRGAVGFVSDYAIVRTGRNLVMQLRQDLFKHLLHLPTRFFAERTSGELLAVITYNIEQVANASTQTLINFLRDSMLAIGLLIVMFTISWQLSLACLLSTPFVAWIVSACSKRLRAISHRVQGSIGSVTHIAEESIKGQRVVRLFNGIKRELERFNEATRHNRNQELKIIVTNAISTSVVQIMVSLPLAVALYMVSALGDKISVGSFVAVALAMGRLLRPVKQLTRYNAEIQKGVAAAQSVFEMLDLDQEKDQGKYRASRVAGEIEFKAVDFSYPNQKAQQVALKKINLHIKPGEKVAFVGHSGAGKSTLISLLPRFHTVTKGEICIDGRTIEEFSLHNLRNQFSYVSQDTVLFNDSVLANIAYGSKKPVLKRAMLAAKAAYADKFIDDLPEGYQTVVGENGVLLSGGQKQRLAIARAIYKDAPILILDEATSSLDSVSEKVIQAALEKLMKGRTALIIAHRLSTIEQCDKIVVLDKGRVVEQGTHESLLAENGKYAKLYRLQIRDHDAK